MKVYELIAELMLLPAGFDVVIADDTGDPFGFVGETKADFNDGKVEIRTEGD